MKTFSNAEKKQTAQVYYQYIMEQKHGYIMVKVCKMKKQN